jgi:hypothetical protein
MKSARIPIIAAVVLLGSCGRVADLKPAPGQPLPVKPLMARETPTASELLTIPTYAKPDRIDELMKRSEPRAADPFDLPPATGGAAPSLPPGSETLPASNHAAPAPPGD